MDPKITKYPKAEGSDSTLRKSVIIRGFAISYSHFCARCSLNGRSVLRMQWDEVKDETPLRHEHAEIWSQVVEICRQSRYQLIHGGALYCQGKKRTNGSAEKSKSYWLSPVIYTVFGIFLCPIIVQLMLVCVRFGDLF